MPSVLSLSLSKNANLKSFLMSEYEIVQHGWSRYQRSRLGIMLGIKHNQRLRRCESFLIRMRGIKKPTFQGWFQRDWRNRFGNRWRRRKINVIRAGFA
ncbi:hypothetical protein ACS0TY_030301 [Phlomoides rotata]